MGSQGCSALVPALLLLAAPQLAASSGEMMDVVFGTQQYQDVAISPDGARLAWVESRPNPDRTPSSHAAVFVAEKGGQPRRVSAAAGRLADEHGVAWSPDGRSLAFLSDARHAGQLELYVCPSDGGAARQVGSLEGYVDDPSWSPDGTRIAVMNITGSAARAGAVEAASRSVGEIEAHPVEARIVVVAVGSGESRAVSPADSYVYEYDWSPDGTHLAAIAAKGDGDDNWWSASLWVIDASGGGAREILRPQRQIAVPRWSPDGSRIAFIQGIMSDRGSTGGDVWVVPSAGGPARDLTPGRRASPSWLHWLPQSAGLLFTESRDGGCAVCSMDGNGGGLRTLWSGDEEVNCGSDSLMQSLSLSSDGRTSALVRASVVGPPEVWEGPVGDWRRVTHANDRLRPLWGPARKIAWTNEGRSLQGWLYLPIDVERGRKYPLVVLVHGGPSSQHVPAWPSRWPSLALPLAEEGYFVFVANPRGSFGQGERFAAANIRDFGGGDYRDIISGLDAVLRTSPVDPARLGICGWSYGGYMTMWAVTQTNRFRAALSGAGLANWQSYYGQNMIDGWMLPFFGASVYDDPEAYARCSPINFIRNVRTPVLVIAGDRDKECPAPQSFEFWHALRARGVEAHLYVYENEGHHFRDPEHIGDLMSRSIDWFNSRLR